MQRLADWIVFMATPLVPPLTCTALGRTMGAQPPIASHAMLHALLVSVISANMIVTAPTPLPGMAPLVSASAATPPLGLVDSIVVEKKAHTLTLFRDGKPRNRVSVWAFFSTTM